MSEKRAMDGRHGALLRPHAPRVHGLRSRWGVYAAFWAAILIAPSLLAMDLNPEIQLSSGMALAREPELLVGPADSAFLVFVDGDQVRFASRPHENPGTLTVAAGSGTRARPSLTVGSGGLVTVGFEWTNGNADVFYAQNPGGPFGAPVPLGQEPEVERCPSLTSSLDSPDRQAVWVRDDLVAGPTLVVAFGLSAPQSVGPGDAPSSAITANGDLVVVYERAGDIFLRSGNGSLGAEVPVTSSASPESHPSIDTGPNGLARIVFERDGDIFFSQEQAGGGFSAPVNVSNSAAASTAPTIRVSTAGIPFVLYEEQGDLWLVVANGPTFGAPLNLTVSAEVETAAAFDVDSLGFVHVAYERGGEVYYRNNSTPPVAAFTTGSSVGELPFSVSFADQSTGVIESWLWDFGDGSTSTEQDPEHVYHATGFYSVSLTVSGPGGNDSVTVPNSVQVTPATRIMRIPSVSVIQGQTDVEIPILVNHLQPMQGFQVSMSWDCDVVDVFAATDANTTTALLTPEFYVVNIESAGCFMTAGVIYDSLPPADGRTLAPGQNQRILDIILNIDSLAPTNQVTVLDLANGLGSPFPISNIFIEAGGQSRSPFLIDGAVTVLPFALPLPTFFRRGDADRSNQVNVADAVFVLSFLFSNGPAFPCPDSADVNDNGSVDIADAIALLGFLFTGGAAPAYPFPSAGLDPTMDALGPCF